MTEDGIIRFTYQGTHFRLRVPQLLDLKDYDFLKALFYILNQESDLSAVTHVQYMMKIAEAEYRKRLEHWRDDAPALVRFEKHLIWLQHVWVIILNKEDRGFIPRSVLTTGCRKYYQDRLQAMKAYLLDVYGVVYDGFVQKSHFHGTSQMLAYLISENNAEIMEVLNGLQRRETDYERRHAAGA